MTHQLETSNEEMRLTIKYFGGAAQLIGKKESELKLKKIKSTLKEAIAALVDTYPDLLPHLTSCRWAVNLEFVTEEHPLSDGDEIALIPPVQGGALRAQLSKTPLSLDTALAQTLSTKYGGTVIFVGSVRDHAQGKSVSQLNYSAYDAMAVAQLDKIASALSNETTEVVINHRIGQLAIGDTAVIISASSPHRDEAFKACRQALEDLKKDVPIWKKETYADGEEWVGWGAG